VTPGGKKGKGNSKFRSSGTVPGKIAAALPQGRERPRGKGGRGGRQEKEGQSAMLCHRPFAGGEEAPQDGVGDEKRA